MNVFYPVFTFSALFCLSCAAHQPTTRPSSERIFSKALPDGQTLVANREFTPSLLQLQPDPALEDHRNPTLPFPGTPEAYTIQIVLTDNESKDRVLWMLHEFRTAEEQPVWRLNIFDAILFQKTLLLIVHERANTYFWAIGNIDTPPPKLIGRVRMARDTARDNVTNATFFGTNLQEVTVRIRWSNEDREQTIPIKPLLNTVQQSTSPKVPSTREIGKDKN